MKHYFYLLTLETKLQIQKSSFLFLLLPLLKQLFQILFLLLTIFFQLNLVMKHILLLKTMHLLQMIMTISKVYIYYHYQLLLLFIYIYQHKFQLKKYKNHSQCIIRNYHMTLFIDHLCIFQCNLYQLNQELVYLLSNNYII